MPKKPQNKRKQAPARDAKGRLLPGHSGNPGGRPKGFANWKAEVQARVPRLLELLMERSEKGDTRAMVFLVEQAEGKATAPIEIDARIQSVVAEQLGALADRIRSVFTPAEAHRLLVGVEKALDAPKVEAMRQPQSEPLIPGDEDAEEQAPR